MLGVHYTIEDEARHHAAIPENLEYLEKCLSAYNALQQPRPMTPEEVFQHYNAHSLL